MKHGNTFYMELSRELFDGYSYKELPLYSRWLFVVLNELEQRYTGKKENYFFRADSDLAKDSGMSVRMVQYSKKILADKGFIQHWNMHWIDTETNKKSEKKVSAYRILK